MFAWLSDWWYYCPNCHICDTIVTTCVGYLHFLLLFKLVYLCGEQSSVRNNFYVGYGLWGTAVAVCYCQTQEMPARHARMQLLGACGWGRKSSDGACKDWGNWKDATAKDKERCTSIPWFGGILSEVHCELCNPSSATHRPDEKVTAFSGAMDCRLWGSLPETEGSPLCCPSSPDTRLLKALLPADRCIWERGWSSVESSNRGRRGQTCGLFQPEAACKRREIFNSREGVPGNQAGGAGIPGVPDWPTICYRDRPPVPRMARPNEGEQCQIITLESSATTIPVLSAVPTRPGKPEYRLYPDSFDATVLSLEKGGRSVVDWNVLRTVVNC